jgi:putative glutamine amidotransferase
MKKIIIGITDCSKYNNYEQWIQNEPGVEVIRLSYRDNNFADLQKCQGILLTGGQDVHPRWYNKPDNIELCEQGNIDEKRDEFEWRVLEYSQEHKLPVLGICRGLQIANVFFGGTLIADIPATGKPDHSKINGVDRYHNVLVKENSLLFQMAGAKNGEVNSAHHQSAELIGTDLVVNATSEDGIIEGLERQQSQGEPFLVLVQWHPERMSNLESEFSKNIKLRFLDEVRV